MSQLARATLRRLLAGIARYPRIKRVLVDLVYRLPWFDGRLRDLAHRVTHPEALLDVDPGRLPEGSRQCLARIKARMPR